VDRAETRLRGVLRLAHAQVAPLRRGIADALGLSSRAAFGFQIAGALDDDAGGGGGTEAAPAPPAASGAARASDAEDALAGGEGSAPADWGATTPTPSKESGKRESLGAGDGGGGASADAARSESESLAALPPTPSRAPLNAFHRSKRV
jgi:hypothetical protein